LNLLDIVPPFNRHLKQYRRAADTDSTLAAYLADAIEALNTRWARTYTITTIYPNTYSVTPDIAVKDKRAIILMGSLIYKMGNVNLASFRDGDFAYDPVQGRTNPIALDQAELDKILGSAPRLATGFTAPIRGFANIYNPESYNYILGFYGFNSGL
jgi:hypothetical protein